jgi:RNase adapter protein RapZ
MQPLRLVIISGLSGSGKTHAIKCFEDLGFFCVDNLPPALLPKFVELCLQRGRDVQNVALGIDIRERSFFSDFFRNLDTLKASGYSVELLFLEARDEILVRRFSESRRPHPLLPHAPVLEGVQLERERLAELRQRADRILDTSDFTVHELKELVARHYVPYDIDLLFDVRFLQNPNFVPDLKPLTGEDPRVQSYMVKDPHTKPLLDHLDSLFRFLIPQFERERRSYLTIAIGCTGGRHRSVAIAVFLKQRFADLGHDVTVRHRDLHRS